MSEFKLLEDSLKPREKYKRYSHHMLSDSELLAIVLRTGTRNKSVVQIANDLIIKYNGLWNLANTEYVQLMKNEGIGEAKAILICAMFEIFNRTRAERILIEKKEIKTPQVIHEYCYELAYLNQEKVILITLNVRFEVISKFTIYTGVLTSVSIHPRDIFKKIINDSGFAFVIVHNHPSGNVEPSDDDLIVTANIAKCAHVFDLKFIDHVIIGGEQYYSIRAEHRQLFKAEL